MFSKRLRFSILLTVITLFYQIVNLSSAQVLKAKVSTGWTEHDLETYPPKINDESYLYYAGKTSDLNGLKIVVKTIPSINSTEKLIQADVSFDYWGVGGTLEADNLATNFFSVGVSAYSEAKPQTVFAYFNDSYLGGDSWGTFESTFLQPVYPARIMITPNLASTGSDNSYYVALKGIQVTYFIENTETVYENVTDTTTNLVTTVTREEKSTRNVTLSCESDDCYDFDLVNGATLYWSDKFFPTKPQTFTKFLTPNTGTIAPYQLTLTKAATTDVCVSINYWLTEASNLTVQLDSSTSTIVLSPTYSLSTSTSIDVADSMYDWYTVQICMSHFVYAAASGNHMISLIPGKAGESEFIAVGEILAADVTTPPLTETTEMILESWTKSSVEPTQQWHYLPSVGSTSNDKNSLLFSSVPNGNSIIYLYSDWFNYTSGLELRQSMGITSCPPKLTVQIQLVDGANNLVSTDVSDLCETKTNTTSQKIFQLAQGQLGQQHRLQFVIHWVEGNSQATLSVSAVDLSDACRDDRVTCSDHGTCQVTQPNEYHCDCDDGYMRERCQKPDYCVLTFSEIDTATGTTTSINGTDYCQQRLGTCNPETFDPVMRKICTCASNNYWKYDASIGHSCAPLDPCTGINVFCPAGYVCNAGTTSDIATCTACDTANGYAADANGTCIKSSPCSSNPCINGGKCKEYENKPVCYCENGATYETATGCDSDVCSLDTRDELACSHTCTTTLGVSHCTCLPGYELVENTTICEPTFNCTANCTDSVGSICLLNANTQSCGCLPGYVLISPANECVDICTAAASNDTQAMDQVKSICGSSTCSMVNSKLTCTCSAPYVNGPDGRCHIETACLPGGKGHAQCSSRGAMCQPKLSATGQDLWECMCPIGTTVGANNNCVDQCSIDEKSCLFDNAVCQKSYLIGATTHDCVCQPGLKKNGQNETDGQCYLIERSLRVEMTTRLDEQVSALLISKARHTVKSFFMSAPTMDEVCPYYAPLDIPGCIDYLTTAAENQYQTQKPTLMEAAIRQELIKNLQSDLANVYGSTFGDIKIIDYSKLNDATSVAGDYKVILSLELTDPKTETNLIPLNDEAVCHPLSSTISEAASYCVIPTHSVIQRASIQQTELIPCNETLIDYCPSNTQCKTLDNSRFSCECNPGFKAETIIQMDMDRSSYYKEYCEDIDECSSTTNPCRAHSSCINTIGSYMCPCNHEYIEDTKTGECISVCSTVTCVHGECIVITNNTGSCRCNEGYRGDTCEEQDPMVKTFRTALITVAVVLGLLLIAVVLVAVILIKKTKRSAMKSNAERPMAEYMAQVPKRYQDNSGFTND